MAGHPETGPRGDEWRQHRVGAEDAVDRDRVAVGVQQATAPLDRSRYVAQVLDPDHARDPADRTAGPGPVGGLRRQVEPEGAGAVREPNAAALIYAGPQHEVYTLSAGMPGREVLDRVQQIAALPQQMLATEFTIQQVELPAAPIVDGSRATWSGRARDEAGTPLRVALTAWHCPGPDVTFVGAYAGPEAIAEADALRVLMSASCP